MSRWSVDGVTSRLDGFGLGPVDLELAPGRAVAVLGRSGAGKTTLLRTLAGFLPVRGGRIVRDGVDVTRAAPERRGLGYVPQGLGLIPHRTVEGNVRYPLDIRGRTDGAARARALLDRFGLAGLARRYPNQLSGGELERVALARALAAEPALVLWDEPWQALDVDARRELGAVFEELRTHEPVPVVVVTHEPALAFSVADELLVLRDGRCAFRGGPADLLDRPIDAFTARFVGYENVFERRALEAEVSGSLGAWLLERSGAGGVAFPRPVLDADGGRTGRWEAVVRSARPTPEGIAVSGTAGSLAVVLRRPPPFPASLSAPGDRIRFDVDEATVRRLGGADPSGGG